MEYAIGLVLSLAILAMATAVGLGRDRAFYPTVMIVIAAYYVLFAAMNAANDILILECLAAAAFCGLALLGFRTRLWLVVLALLPFTGHRSSKEKLRMVAYSTERR